MVAAVVLKARLIATAAPMLLPVAGPVVVAVPEAVAVESVLPFADSVRAPVAPAAPMVRPSGIVAVWWTTLMVTAIAAATCSGVLLPELFFSELSALGVAFAPETLLPEPALSSVALLAPRSR